VAYKPKRGKPYVWVTWITKFLAEEERCALRVWFRTRFDYDKLPESPERKARLAEWTVEHDKLVNHYAEHQRAQGNEVTLEDANAFKLEGRLVIISGKPDIVIRHTLGRVVVDGKTGKKRESDHWQVRIYLIALPLTLFADQDSQAPLPLDGRVLYKEMLHDVKLDDSHKAKLRAVVEMIGSPKAPPATPSRFECDRCNIADCTKRFKDAAKGTTDLF